MPKTLKLRAPAKVNLCLHVTGQREDGYHLLDSLVAFGPAHDLIAFTKADTQSLVVDGPESADLPTDMNNLALRAAALCAMDRGGALTLTKNLPAASGIGGGSADAAAAYLAAGMALDGLDLDNDLPDLVGKLAPLGADIPMCLFSRPLRARGIGEQIDPVMLPRIPVVLANPRIPIATPDVFRKLKQRENPPLPETLPEWADVIAFCDWLKTTRNDLEAPAIALEPTIATVKDALTATDGAILSRMSGSGATCFAIYDTEEYAAEALAKLRRDHPNWWHAAGLFQDYSTGSSRIA